MNKQILLLIPALAAIFCIRAQEVAFINVNVIPMDQESVLQNQTVLVKDGWITEIGKTVKIPHGAERIDGRGKYLIPGLADMHVHLLADSEEYPDSIAEDELKIMVANGITTIRVMIGTPQQLKLRRLSAEGKIISPAIFAASPHLTGKAQGNDFVVTTEAAAREAVRESKAAGYDFIKVTTFLDANIYEAAVDEASKLDIPVVGHADSRYVGVERAFRARQQIEHLDGYLEALLKPDAPVAGSVSDIYIYNPENWKSLEYIDRDRIPELARLSVAANPFTVPTQHFMKNTFGLPRTEESVRKQPDFKFYPKEVQDFYIDYMKKTRLNEVPLEERAEWVELRNMLIRAIYDEGGKILAGSDTPEFLWLYGYSLHRELQALSDAGLSNYAVLEAATKNPALFLETINLSGTIEKGKRADLVLLNANPIENIGNTSNREGVMLDGKYYLQSLLNKWLDEIAPRIANSHTPH